MLCSTHLYEFVCVCVRVQLYYNALVIICGVVEGDTLGLVHSSYDCQTH